MQEQLKKFANQDLNLARKNGCITIAQTKIGNIDVEYNSARRLYILNGNAMKKADAIDYIVASYDVVKGQ